MRKSLWTFSANKNFDSTKYSLIIRTEEDIDLDEVQSHLCLNNPRIIRKGDIVSRFIGKSKRNIYIYEETYDYKDETFEKLSTFLEKIITKKELLISYMQKAEVVIRLFAQSSQAQMYFYADPKLIEKLYTLELPVEISILSWGEVNNKKPIRDVRLCQNPTNGCAK